MYVTACIPEVAKRIDDYFEYRMRFGEACKLYEKRLDHKHEYYDGYGENVEVIERWYKADEPHLDPDAPLIREDFDRNDPFAAKYPRRISDHQINDIIRIAAEAAGVRVPNEGTPFKRHKVMLTHGFRKLFKKRCRQAKVDAITIERFMDHKSGNSRDGITKLMMTYDPEDWAEMQDEFEKAIPILTIT
jgi:integrase